MADINALTIVGRLTKDVELSFTSNNNTALAKFSIAVNEFKGGGKPDEVSYFDVTVWGKMAEICNQYIGKGKQVVINGRLKQDTWKDKTSGDNRSKVTIIAQNVQFVGGKGEGQDNSAPKKQENTTQSNDAFSNTNFKEEDIPF